MKKTWLLCLTFVALLAALPAFAAPLKVYVGKINASGGANRDEVQATLQTLLASRLSGDGFLPVGSAAEADAVVTGSYIVFGKVFSLDAVATSAAGRIITRAFVQGENQDELIPAVGTLAGKLAAGLVAAGPEASASTPVTPAKTTASSALVYPATEKKAAVMEAKPQAGDIVKITEAVKERSGSWRSQPLSGNLNLVAVGSVRTDGSRDVFLADNRRLAYYRQGKELQLVTEKELKIFEKIIALDVLDVGNDTVELYLTVMANEELVSTVLLVKDGSLKPVATNLPYFFRIMSLPGSVKKLYVQKTADKRPFNGEIYEAERKGAEIVLKAPLKLPPEATLYRFAQFSDRSGAIFTAVISTENQLVVFDQQQREVWRSLEKYGGSELFMEKQELNSPSRDDQGPPKFFLNQRIVATVAGEILVGKNEEFVLLGKNWNYSNGMVYCLAWSGESLEAKWHTRVAQYYMPDFYYDEPRKELLQLELTQRPYILSKGSMVLTIKKIE